MNDSTAVTSNSQPKFEAGAAGVGGGTLLALLANNLPDSNLKSWLVILAPSASIVLSALWLWIRTKIDGYFKEKKFRALINRARQTLSESLNNPNTSPEHKAQLRRNLEELELIHSTVDLERVKIMLATESAPKGTPQTYRELKD